MEEKWTLPVAFGEKLTLQGSTNTGDNSSTGTINVDGERLQDSLNSIMSKLDTLLSEASKHVTNFSVAEVKVSLAVDASGSVSVLGVFKASAATKGAIEVKFIPRS
ncbi:hypothetical protein HAP41_0000043220 [Bradyrhizobium barranii subsp. apii]|uniref:Pepco domain-containing protein n=1 Tax=Bradyrhizobium barranii subsp. apii TaxID=2819348 RepID=A0A8T5VAW3_9BRAD|nr:hypothetical protein [Bradyrhizobium barranii]UPT86959.1 hypothetical protein HAP41_0000043220 [Bradyrhizobium barranii subsp. apii]